MKDSLKYLEIYISLCFSLFVSFSSEHDVMSMFVPLRPKHATIYLTNLSSLSLSFSGFILIIFEALLIYNLFLFLKEVYTIQTNMHMYIYIWEERSKNHFYLSFNISINSQCLCLMRVKNMRNKKRPLLMKATCLVGPKAFVTSILNIYTRIKDIF